MTRYSKDGELKTLIVGVRGMHCPNCEVLIERCFKSIPGIHAVKARHYAGTVTIRHDGDVSLDALQRALGDEDYAVTATPEGQSIQPNTTRDYAEIAAAFAILLGLYLLLDHFDLIPRNITVSSDMSYGLAVLIGLVASVSSCIAVTGGLLVAVAAKYNETTGTLPGMQRMKPLIYFNAGRIASYTLLGGVVGAIGSALTLSAGANGILTIVASIVMILLGLQMLKVFPAFGRFLPSMPKAFAHKIHDLAARETKGGAFALGAATFFLPCGFTQALQLYILAKGSFVTGALTMLAFALGTLPALMSLSAMSSFATGDVQRRFLKFAGAAVIVLGLLNIQNGLELTGTGFESALARVSAGPSEQTAGAQAEIANGKQVVVMKVSGFEYSPNHFIVKQGIPVEWRIDAAEAAGCGRILIAPRLGVRRLLSSNSTTFINFVPQETGDFAFNCGMGMMTRGSHFTVVSDANG